MKHILTLITLTTLTTNSYAQNEEKTVDNLFQLSQLLVSKENNTQILPYLNYLAKKNNIDYDDKILVDLKKNINDNDIKKVFEKNLINVLKDNLNNKSIIEEKERYQLDLKKLKKDLKINTLNEIAHNNLKYNFDFDKNKLDTLLLLNNVLFTYKSVNILEKIKEEIGIELTNFDPKEIENKIIQKVNEGNKDLNSQNTQQKKYDYNNITSEYCDKIEKFKNTPTYRFLEKYVNTDTKPKPTDSLEIFLHDIKYIKNHYDEIRNYRNELFNKLIADVQITTKGKNLTYQYGILDSQIESNLKSNNFALYTPVAAQEKAPTSFKLPSESEAIMALANFMANRAKQETMIWFMDKLKNEMRNALVQDAFPNTLNLIQDHDEFKIPEFNSNWQKALSTDFIQFPTNIINSNWLENKAQQNDKVSGLNQLKNTINLSNYFFKIVNGKNNYRSILEQLYLQKANIKPVSDSSPQLNQHLFEAIELLYIVSNEFFDVTEVNGIKKARLLTYRDLAQVNHEQWDIIKNLIKLKYGIAEENAVVKLIDKISDAKEKNNKFSNILSSLQDLELISKSENFNSVEQKTMVILENVLSLVKHIDPNYSPFTNTFNSTVYTQIDQFEKVLNIYKTIHQKDFGKSTKQILELAKPLFKMDQYCLKINDNKLSVLNTNSKDINNSELIKITLPLRVTGTIDISTKSDSIIFNGKAYKIQELKSLLNELKYYSHIETIESKHDFHNYLLKLKNREDFKKFNVLLSNFIPVDNIVTVEMDYNEILKNLKTLSFIVDIAENPTSILNNNLYDHINVNKIAKNFNKINNSTDNLIKITNFFSEIITAKDQRDFYKAIENNVAPPTSYITKRKSDNTITLNGYVGAYIGHQVVNSSLSDYKSGFAYGITAPVGFTYSKPKWGVFVHALDLGNLVGHYLWEKNKNFEKQKVTVKEIFSPGINVMYNIPNSPFVVFSGVKFIQIEERRVPNVGVINADGLDIFQFSVGIKIDIPFFTISKW